jgi:hypothetical protein
MRFKRQRPEDIPGDFPGDFIVPDTLRQRGHEQWLESRCLGQNPLLQRKPAWSKCRRAIATAMSVVMAHAIEGFASCAVGMYPELFHPLSGQAHRRDLSENGSPGQPVDKQRH